MQTFKKHNFREYVSLYFRFLRMDMLSRMQYKLDVSLVALGVMMREGVAVVTLYLILQKFSVIHGWDLGQLLFMYSFVFITYSLCIIFFTGFRDFEGIVHRGELDMYLTKPTSPLFIVMARRADIMATLGHGTLGLLLFIYSYRLIDLPFHASTLVMIMLTMIGGILIQGSLMMIPACFSFWTTKSSELQNLLYIQMRGFIAYPITIYPKWIQALLTYVIPLAFVNFYPAQYFFDTVLGWMTYLTPIVGVMTFSLALLVWKTGIMHYKSTGH